MSFAPEAFQDRRSAFMPAKMYPQYNRLNVPTWIIGPALGEWPLIDRPADVLKGWPTREPIQRLPPAQFNPLVDQLVTRHCRYRCDSAGRRHIMSTACKPPKKECDIV